MVIVCIAQLYRVCAQGEAAAPLHPQGTLPVPHLVAGHVARSRVRHLCTHHGQHADAGDEGELLVVTYLLITQQTDRVSFAFICGRREHITPVLRELHWLPVRQRID